VPGVTRALALFSLLSPFLSFQLLVAPVRPLALSPFLDGPAAQNPRPGVGPADRPTVDAAAADRGRHVWAAECITCHGAQARGTDTGPNLIRSMVVLRDRYGSELGPFLRKGHPMQSGAPSASLSDVQVVDLTHFLRQRINDTLRGSAVFVPQQVVSGNPSDGAAYFTGDGGCSACHSASGDLAGVGSRIPNPVDLQQRLLFPTGRAGRGGSSAMVKVTVTPAAGQALSGTLVQMDDFYVTLRDDTGAIRVVKRSPSTKVVKTDPLQAHHDLLRRISDRNIYDLVAYLASLK